MKIHLSIVCAGLLVCHAATAQKQDRFMGETVNYDEDSVPPYVLPPLLKTLKGKTVSNTTTWEKVRRPEIIHLFEENVYGYTPSAFDSIRYRVTNDEPAAMTGRAHLKEVAVSVWNRGKSVTINLVLFTPNKQSRPAPVFLLINNRGKRNTDPTRAVKSEFWPAEMVIDSGFAIAAFHVSDVAPDNKTNYQQGVLDQLFPEQLGRADGMKAIGAWAWAASRVMDYLQTDPAINPKQVAIVGHSRGGKTSLWAGAQDQRFAMVVSSCSGSSGASLARRQYGETISLINKQFGYWFNDNYKKYSHNEAALPVDQHMLLALIAPRPLYTTNAVEDRWADPRGSYLSVVNALPAYQLYDKKLTLPLEMPATNKPVWKSAIGYHYREGKHDLNLYDWTEVVRFAQIQFKTK
ncbi:Prolyl oligopeptidase family protein [Chitinophaga jiangningensis]|uniref:Prolyl oligopeptidase family protein n=1 Tax=Chitinophaga jiangningensis TaxID=1419482 RepID=A0A1M7C420_9BACT|nr:prolyl oligopeptidase family serine peptidase [Chitinophaga jiangningensis]SHL61970.1 Prolyl oligopeptidase family protein [Chitinophaga jiangningensis]